MNAGVDIGGTHIRVASGTEGKIDKKLDFPTQDFASSLNQIVDSIKQLSPNENPKVGIAVPGPIETKSNLLKELPNLPTWRGQPLQEKLAEKLGTEVKIEHDASLAALAEFKLGAGVGKDPLLYYTVSTGIGAGLIYRGKIYRGVYNPEPGQQIVTGTNLGLEDAASGRALTAATGKNPIEIEGSPDWEKALERLARGITNSILHYSPQTVIIGGGLTKNEEKFFPPLVERVRGFLKIYPLPEITRPALGQDVTLIGALLLASS